MGDIIAIDLFCGAGGWSLGAKMANESFKKRSKINRIKVMAAYDKSKQAIVIYNQNHEGNHGIVADLSISDFSEYKDKVDLVFASPPCQGFSSSGKREPLDPRNTLLIRSAEICLQIMPRWFVLENVAGLTKGFGAKYLEALRTKLTKAGYFCLSQIINTRNIGIAQNRERLILIATQLRSKFLWHVMDFVIERKEVPCSKVLGNINDPVYHKVKPVPEKHKQAIADLPYGSNYPVLGIQTRKLDPNKPAYCITTNRSGHYHYSEPRYLSVRESARLQTFPDSFKFSLARGTALREIGNAVPPKLSKLICQKIMSIDSLQ